MNRINIFVVIFICTIASSCHKKLTPEEVTRAYVTNLANGNCETAKKYCTEESKSEIDIICDTTDNFNLMIDSIVCTENKKETAVCWVYRKYDSIDQFKFDFQLTKEKGEWKVIFHPKAWEPTPIDFSYQ